MDVLTFITVLIFLMTLKSRRNVMSLPAPIQAQFEDIYEKHLAKMLAIYKDVDRAELEAMSLAEKEMEND